MSLLLSLLLLNFGASLCGSITTPKPDPQYDWNHIDSRPLPTWFDKAKIGIFIHWGVFSVPSYTSEWFWINWRGKPPPDETHHRQIKNFMKRNYKPGFSYQDFARDFTAEFYDAQFWANLIKKSGAKYVVLTSKHHDGYALWPSKYSFSWNSMDVGPHRDLIGELRHAINKTGIHFGLYHSLFEWFNPLYLSDKKNNFTTQYFVNNKILPEMKELVLRYEPEIFWSDGEWEASSEYWKSLEFLTWLYNNSTVANTVVVNDRWGHGTLCKHGGYYTCSDRYNPGTLQRHKWENAMTLDKHTWGYNRTSTLKDYLTINELIKTMVETIAFGGNILINIGPAKDGTISPIFEERLTQLGDWLNINGEAIYESQPWEVCQNDTTTPDIWYTTKDNGTTLYTIMLNWPENNTLYLACADVTNSSQITMLGLHDKLQASTTAKKMLKIGLPDKAKVKNDWAWIVKITNAKIP
uniref:Putative alpha-L-fucosidase n=1 Tax=Pristhesancus plagipennis TaxID=1955184 RepID=A0A2K8JM54_PRIPG|nr:secreted Glycosyl hydrolase-like protein [Pristhesancus plagipennis]